MEESDSNPSENEELAKTRGFSKRCKATSKSTGERCRRPAVRGEDYCRFHGGKGIQASRKLVGMKSGAFKTGKYSKILPKKIGDTYEKGLQDPRLLELREEIALADARLVELAERIGTGESDGVWTDLRTLWASFMYAVKTGDEAQQNELLADINSKIRIGATTTQQWAEIKEFQDHRRKMSESEQKRMQVAQQMIAVESVMVLMSATIETLKESVMLYADEETSIRILEHASRKYKQLVGAGADSNRSFVEVQSD